MNKLLLLARHRALQYVLKGLAAVIRVLIGHVAKLTGAPGTDLRTSGELDLSALGTLTDAPTRGIATSAGVGEFTLKVLCKAYDAVVVKCQSSSIGFNYYVRPYPSGSAIIKLLDQVHEISVTCKAVVSRGWALGTYMHDMFTEAVAKVEAATGRVLRFGGHHAYTTYFVKAVAVRIVNMGLGGLAGLISILHTASVIAAEGRTLNASTETMSTDSEISATSAWGRIMQTVEGIVGATYLFKASISPTKRVTANADIVFINRIDAGKAIAEVADPFDEEVGINHKASSKVWNMPILEDGVLYIRQAYDVVQNGNVLEVM